jgi:hypothetical protein
MQQTFGPTMIHITGREGDVSPGAVLDIEAYYRAILGTDFGAHDLYEDFPDYGTCAASGPAWPA